MNTVISGRTPEYVPSLDVFRNFYVNTVFFFFPVQVPDGQEDSGMKISQRSILVVIKSAESKFSGGRLLRDKPQGFFRGDFFFSRRSQAVRPQGCSAVHWVFYAAGCCCLI